MSLSGEYRSPVSSNETFVLNPTDKVLKFPHWGGVSGAEVLGTLFILSKGNTMKKRLLALVMVCCMLASCGSIVNGTKQSVYVNSDPAGAAVMVDGLQRGETPCELQLERDKAYELTLEKKGYKPASAYVRREPSGWVCGNLLFGGIIGILVDGVSGGMWKLEPEHVSVSMEKQ